jgi:hypothetical protein
LIHGVVAEEFVQPLLDSLEKDGIRKCEDLLGVTVEELVSKDYLYYYLAL